MMVISIAILIGLLILSFKITWFIIKLCGKVLGAILCSIGYILLGSIGIGLIGLVVVVIPVVAIIGILAICNALGKMV